MTFEWISDPAAWTGLATLIVLEIVLGIDNLVFIAILADKLPPHQRDKARIIGLSLALLMRLGLLASISWIVTLTEPLFSLLGKEFSGRDLIFVLGGIFLLFKGTMELHERLEGDHAPKEGKVVHAVFWQVIVQIVVLDAVFSIDSVITAVGMAEHLAVMVIAVTVAIAVMMLAAKPLTAFVSKHPTVVILCLGFLMMIGFALIVEGFGFYVPKGYLYAAIGFSIIVEAFNQTARRNRARLAVVGDLRARTSDAVLRLIGGRANDGGFGQTTDFVSQKAAAEAVFAPEEKAMIAGVLTLAERPAASIMTPRTDVDWLDIGASAEETRRRIIELGHSRFLLARRDLDDFVGVALAKDLLRDIIEEGAINLERSLKQPLVVHESVKVLRLIEQLRRTPLQMAIIVDEYGSLEGIATPTDVLEAIAGEFPEGEDDTAVERTEDGSWLVDGWADARRLSELLGANIADPAGRYSTLAGYLLWQLGHLPATGDKLAKGDLLYEIVAMEGRSIGKVRITRATAPAAAS